jgi:bifunctional ADP-heptose synthase (sugar kinase/adenylyltransferase)
MLDEFAGVRALVIGDLVRERYVYCDASEAAGDAPVLSLQRLGSADYWGAAAAVALQLQALGAQPFLLASAGEDQTSRPLAHQFAQLGISSKLLPSRPRLVERRTFVADETKLLKLTDGVCSPLDSAWEKRAAAALGEQLAHVQLLIWCDHGYGMITPGLVRSVAGQAHRREVTVVGYAAGQRGEIAALNDTDLLTLTERQLREAMHDMGSGLPAVAWKLLNRTNGRAMLVALRRRGLIGFERPSAEPRAAAGPERLRSEFVPSFTGHCVDLAGVEEAVLSAAALAYATGRALPMATYVAGAAEALTMSRSGFEPVTVDQLYAWFAKRPELRSDSRFYPDPATLGDLARLAPPLATEMTR